MSEPQPGLHLRMTLTDGLTLRAESVTTIIPHQWLGYRSEQTQDDCDAIASSALRQLMKRWAQEGKP